jgi:Zn-dependent peptidase ImmA (M78 family)
MTASCEKGLYYCIDGVHYIAINPKRSRKEREFIGWHEFAHFLQNFYDRAPVAAFSGVEPSKTSEKHADNFAFIAVNENVRITGPMDFIKMIMRTKL